MRGSMGLASAMLASNAVHGPFWDVEEAEAAEPSYNPEPWPKGEFGIIDCYAQYSAQPPERRRYEGYSTPIRDFMRAVLLGSETSLIVLVGLPSREVQPRGPTPVSSGGVARVKDTINRLAGCERALSLGNVAPNHYWDLNRDRPDIKALEAQMDREARQYRVAGWNWYCHTDPGRSGRGFRLDDHYASEFYEKSRALGITVFSVSKGFRNQSQALGDLANPEDVEQAALSNPDLTFIIRNLAIRTMPGRGELADVGFIPATGDFQWLNVLLQIKRRNPSIDNIYIELDEPFGRLALDNPMLCQHALGKAIQTYGVDHILWGTGLSARNGAFFGAPQWSIELFKRFQITDEMVQRWGYTKLTAEDKQKIFALNAAKVFGIDLSLPRRGLPADWEDQLEGGGSTPGLRLSR